ncbi:hypothetical protein NQZ68_031856 [Dissostichus eleginoides]|nr:hypothetical protein NQZ68_031856 [Dissostichus eleginoides]
MLLLLLDRIWSHCRDRTGISSVPAGGEGDGSCNTVRRQVNALRAEGIQRLDEHNSKWGRLNDVAPRPAPPALGADSPDPEAPRSLSSITLLSFSHPPVIFIQPGVPFALYGLLPSRSPLHATTALKHSFPTQHHITSVCSRRQLHQIERVSPVGGGQCFPALGAAKHSVAYMQVNSI